MSKQKNLAELNAEKDKIEQQLAQERHKIHRLENRAAYSMKRGIGANGRTTLSPMARRLRASHRRQRL